MICDWIETSSAETGSSATISFGVERERAGDRDALALAAGEFVRVAGDAPRRAGRRGRSSSAHALSALPRRADAMHVERLADDGADAVARIERAERILEDDLHVAPAPLHARRAAARRDPRPRTALRPRVGSIRRSERAAERGLSAAGFADDAEHLAALEREAHIVDRPHAAARRPA